jgi:hypothetical protein
VDPPETITCVDCGGICHLLTVVEPDEGADEMVAAYRCEDCLDRWDMVIPDEADDDGRPT